MGVREQSEGEPLLSVHSQVVQAEGVLAAASDDELLLIREPSANCYVLRGSGADIWNAAGHPVQIAAICSALSQTYAVDPTSCERSVLELVEELVRERLFLRVD